MQTADRVFALLAAAVVALSGWVGGRPVEGELPPRARVVVRPLELPGSLRRAVLGRGDTLGDTLDRLGVPSDQIPAWAAATQRLLDVRSLPVGLVAEAVLDYHGTLTSVRLTPDWRATIVLEPGDAGVQARREARPVEREMAVVRGSVTSSLFGAVDAAGEDEALAIQLAELFQWDIDFHREVQPGDTFALLVERVRSEGRIVAYGPIVGAEYINSGKRFVSVRYATAEGRPGYYDLKGRPLKKAFLRSPLRFSRVTSRFSMNRMHPVLGRRLPHYGVDYGAPAGTPVMATADGTVSFTGRKGGGGNTVEIRHAGGYVTAYLHLSRFAVRPGTRVEQGQVIGYVGSTGLSTGPHLDYRVTLGGRYVNPLMVGKEPSPPLPPTALPAFTRWAERVLPMLLTPGRPSAEAEASLRAGSPVRFDA